MDANSPWVKPLIYLTFYHLLTPTPLASIDNLDQRRTTYRLICIRVLLNQPEIFVRLIKWKTVTFHWPFGDILVTFQRPSSDLLMFFWWPFHNLLVTLWWPFGHLWMTFGWPFDDLLMSFQWPFDDLCLTFWWPFDDFSMTFDDFSSFYYLKDSLLLRFE